MFNPEDYTIISSLFPRLLGAIYFIAFWPFLFQIKGLIGQHGILPASSYLQWIKQHYKKRAYFLLPTCFWLNASDKALMAVVWLGCTLSILLMFGVFPSFLLFCLILLYISIISVGQDFLSFGWEVFLQEVAVNALLLSLTPVPNLMVWISINFLLFRFYIQSGAVKIQSKDRTWDDLTALAYHYESQPIPNVMAWYVHKLPLWCHKVSCLIMFAIELVVPFGIFLDESIRVGCCICFLALQFFIWVTGNFSYLNYLTAVFSLILLNNTTLERFGFVLQAYEPSSLALDITLSLLGAALLILQLVRLWDHFYPNVHCRRILQPLSWCHLVNRYGIFAIMTTTRYEVVLEGSDDAVNWKEYLFYHKPSEITRRPRRISPYQPRLDWQAWFLPFRPFEFNVWFHNFIERLLHGSPEVLKLLRYNPFPEHPPKYVRAVLYLYTFSSFKEKKETGRWWNRQIVAPYGPICSLKKQA